MLYRVIKRDIVDEESLSLPLTFNLDYPQLFIFI